MNGSNYEVDNPSALSFETNTSSCFTDLRDGSEHTISISIVQKQVTLSVDDVVDGLHTGSTPNMLNMNDQFFVGANAMGRGFRGEVYDIVVNDGHTG